MERTVIFLHIPKTAGNTMYQIIERNCSRKAMYVFGIDGGHDDFKCLSDDRKSELRVIGGHAGFGMHRFLPGPSVYFTLFREPVERVISYYYYACRAPDTYAHNSIYANRMGLKDFIASKQDAMVDNGQTRLLAGLESGHEVGFGQCTHDMLETAKRNLREHFAVVGLTEEFDATLILLKKAFGWQKLVYVQRNVSENRPQRDEIPQATLDAIAKVNVLDAELYQYARTLFEEQVRRQGPSFAQEVRDFQIADRRLSPFIRLYWKARKVSVRTMIRKWIQPWHSLLAPV